VLDERVAQRRAVAARYRAAFVDLDGLSFMPQPDWADHTNWLSCFTVDERRLGCSRDFILERLRAQDIEARPIWKPMHRQPLFADCEVFGGAVADDLFARGLCLPSSSNLTTRDQDAVIQAVRDAVVGAAQARAHA
jgi:pyridoxal phosphate-dependent aminotransferase EpsN